MTDLIDGKEFVMGESFVRRRVLLALVAGLVAALGACRNTLSATGKLPEEEPSELDTDSGGAEGGMG